MLRAAVAALAWTTLRDVSAEQSRDHAPQVQPMPRAFHRGLLSNAREQSTCLRVPDNVTQGLDWSQLVQAYSDGSQERALYRRSLCDTPRPICVSVDDVEPSKDHKKPHNQLAASNEL